MEYVLLALIFIVLFMSIISIWTMQWKPNHYVSLENLFVLLLLYFTMLIGFGLIYAVLQMKGYDVLQKNVNETDERFFIILRDSLYFSATTLLSVGYGDIIPVGVGRWIAVIEALLGYITPAVLVVRTVIDFEKR